MQPPLKKKIKVPTSTPKLILKFTACVDPIEKLGLYIKEMDCIVHVPDVNGIKRDYSLCGEDVEILRNAQGTYGWVFGLTIGQGPHISEQLMVKIIKHRAGYTRDGKEIDLSTLDKELKFALLFSNEGLGPTIYNIIPATLLDKQTCIKYHTNVIIGKYYPDGHLTYADVITTGTVSLQAAQNLWKRYLILIKSGIVHGDIKPHNMLVIRRKEDKVVLDILFTDFGLTKTITHDKEGEVYMPKVTSVFADHYKKHFPLITWIMRTFDWTKEKLHRNPHWHECWVLIIICIVNRYHKLLNDIENKLSTDMDFLFGPFDNIYDVCTPEMITSIQQYDKKRKELEKATTPMIETNSSDTFS